MRTQRATVLAKVERVEVEALAQVLLSQLDLEEVVYEAMNVQDRLLRLVPF